MNRPILFSFFLLYSLLFLNTVSNAASGYYVKLNGDTVKGTFLKIPETGNPSQVDFIPANAMDVTVLKPDEIRSFKVGNYELFLSYNGERRLNSAGDSNTAHNSETIHTFLRELGQTYNYWFFSYSDSKKLSVFYSSNDYKVVELLNNDLAASAKTKDEYHDQLNAIFISKVDSIHLNPMLRKLDYSEEGFINFIDELNDFGGDHIQAPPVHGLFLTFGYMVNLFSVTGTNSVPSVATKYDNSSDLFFGLSYVKPIRKASGRYFLCPNIKVFSYSHSGSISRYDAVIKTTFSSDYVIYPALNVGYNFVNKNAFKVFFSTGFGALVLLNNKEVNEYAYYDGTASTVETKGADVAFDLNLSTGITMLNKYMIWIGYDIPAATANHQYYTGYLSGLQAGLGYKF